MCHVDLCLKSLKNIFNHSYIIGPRAQCMWTGFSSGWPGGPVCCVSQAQGRSVERSSGTWGQGLCCLEITGENFNGTIWLTFCGIRDVASAASHSILLSPTVTPMRGLVLMINENEALKKAENVSQGHRAGVCPHRSLVHFWDRVTILSLSKLSIFPI